MVDIAKLAKGDKIIDSLGNRYLVIGIDPKYKAWLKVREVYDGGIHAKYESGLYIPTTNFDTYNKVYEWTKWRNHICPDGKTAKYKTNRRDIKFKRDGVEVSASCHEEDVFNLEHGLELCWNRWNEKMKSNANNVMDTGKSAIVKPKKINVNDLRGQQFGNYVAVSITGKDKSRHNIWMCVCPTCGDVIYATAYDLMHGRKKVSCKCDKSGNTSSSTNTNSTVATSGYIQTMDDKDGIATSNTAVAITTTNWYDDGSTTTTYSEYKDNTITSDEVDNTIDKNKVNINISYSDEVKQDIQNYMNLIFTQHHPLVFSRETKADLLSFPVYYRIAHCIPADLTFYGETAKRINKMYNLEHIFKINDYYGWVEAGDAISEANVYTLLPNKAKFTKVDMSTLRECLKMLADYCVIDGVQHLAMPRICTGGNKLPWVEVKQAIIDVFTEVYNNRDEAYPIYIDFCYK